MKKKLLFCSFFIILILSLSFLVFPFTNESIPDGGDDGGGTLWSRYDYPCIGSDKEKTNCISGGSEQCTAKYCN